MKVFGEEYPGSIAEWAQMYSRTRPPGSTFQRRNIEDWLSRRPSFSDASPLIRLHAASRIVAAGKRDGLWRKKSVKAWPTGSVNAWEVL